MPPKGNINTGKMNSNKNFQFLIPFGKLFKYNFTWFELSVHSFESSLDAVVPEVQVDPLGGRKTEDGVELGLGHLQQVVALKNVVITEETDLSSEQTHGPTC